MGDPVRSGSSLNPDSEQWVKLSTTASLVALGKGQQRGHESGRLIISVHLSRPLPAFPHCMYCD